MAESPRPRRSAGTWFQSLYVRVLLRLLPHLINVFKHVSPKIRARLITSSRAIRSCYP